jgi:hypothetical protein
MSFIYEALKRAEDENARGASAPRVGRRRLFFATAPRWWLWALIAVLAANAALLVTLVLFRGSPPPAEVMTTTANTEGAGTPVVASPRDADAAPETPSAPAPAPPTAVPSARTVAPTPPVARAARPAPPSVARAARPAAPTTAVATPAAPPAPPVVAPISPPSPVVPPAASPPAPEAAPAAVDRPKLQIQVVLYSDVPAERLVFIDGRRYAEGEKVDAETVVERITPQGAVITRRGQSFTLISGRP